MKRGDVYIDETGQIGVYIGELQDNFLDGNWVIVYPPEGIDSDSWKGIYSSEDDGDCEVLFNAFDIVNQIKDRLWNVACMQCI